MLKYIFVDKMSTKKLIKTSQIIKKKPSSLILAVHKHVVHVSIRPHGFKFVLLVKANKKKKIQSKNKHYFKCIFSA